MVALDAHNSKSFHLGFGQTAETLKLFGTVSK